MSTFAQLLRKTQSLRSAYQEIIDFCVPFVAAHKNSDDSWLAREQLIKAYLDQGDVDSAVALVRELEEKFGLNSQRVALLRGLTLEAQGDFERALALYMDLLAKNRNNVLAAKRIVVVKRSQGDSCVQTLNLLIQDNQADVEVWFELMEVELVRGAYDEALFCGDEVLLANPHSHHILTLYGEILESNKREESSGRQYFAQALVVNPQSTRAAWCLLFSAASGENKDDLAAPLSAKAKELLLKHYSKSPMLDLVKPCIDKL